jgi:hypothetical protein
MTKPIVGMERMKDCDRAMITSRDARPSRRDDFRQLPKPASARNVHSHSGRSPARRSSCSRISIEKQVA